MKDFSNYKIFSQSACVVPYNGKTVERTIKKAFPNDEASTLFVVKVRDVSEYLELYEDEMIE